MKKAFTIIELLVVISVLVILIGIAIPRFKGMQDAARIAQAKGEMHTLQSAIESYYTNALPKAYPPTTPTVIQNYLVTASPQIIPMSPPYDPFLANNTEYNYSLAADGKYYVVYSVGVNGSGTATVVNGGTVTIAGGAICASNGIGC